MIIDAREHKFWGDRIQWFNWDTRKIVGWLDRIPSIGDEIRFQMQSGKVAQFEVIEIERCRDPQDMFFATLKDIGYLNDG